MMHKMNTDKGRIYILEANVQCRNEIIMILLLSCVLGGATTQRCLKLFFFSSQ